MSKTAKTDFRVIGGDAKWWAYHTYRSPPWGPHQKEVFVTKGKRRLRVAVAVMGKTPTEALYRLKRQLVAA